MKLVATVEFDGNGVEDEVVKLFSDELVRVVREFGWQRGLSWGKSQVYLKNDKEDK